MSNSSASRAKMLSSLLHLKHSKGFEPKTVIDIGAALGTFELYDAFPLARHFMVEPILENEPYLAKLCSKLPHAEYIIAAAASRSGFAELQIKPELVHSSVTEVYPTQSSSHQQETTTNAYVRKVPAVTVDEICHQYKLESPYLIKLDVDGNEPDVLLGATQALKDTEYLVIEVSLFGQIHQVIDLMRSQGFVIYDIVDLLYRPTDNALWQADMAFVREEGQFRQDKNYIPEAHQYDLDAYLRTWRDEYIKAIDQLQPSQYCAPSTSEGPLPGETEHIDWENLRSINLLICPDWDADDSLLNQQLFEVLKVIFTHPQKHLIAMLIDVDNVAAEVVDLLLASLMLSLAEEIELDESEEQPNFILLSSEEMAQLQAIASRITTQVLIGCDRPAHQSIQPIETIPLKNLSSTHYSVS